MAEYEVRATVRLKGNDVTYSDSERDEYGGTDVQGHLSKDPLTLRTVKWFRAWITEHKDLCHREDLELFGRYLYEYLFQGEVRQAFEKMLEPFVPDASNKNGRRLRVELVFEQDDALAGYPWEFLYVPRNPAQQQGGLFLAAPSRRTNLVLTRMVPLKVEIGQDPLPLRILVVVCRPKDQPSVDAEEVVNEISDLGVEFEEDEGAASPPPSGRPPEIVVRVLDDPDYATLSGKIRDERHQPHIVHFIGHGTPSGLIMRRDAVEYDKDFKRHQARNDGSPPPRASEEISSESFANLLDPHVTRLVFLQACNTDVPSREGLWSTARRLAYEEVPAVVAMQFEIENGVAKVFARKFYRALAQGNAIAEAVLAGRRELADVLRDGERDMWASRDFGTPVLYLQRESGTPIVKIDSTPEQSQPPTMVSGPASPSLASGSAEGGACPKCTVPIDRANKYCSGCGAGPFCLKCRGLVTGKFCGECGTPLDASAEKREQESFQKAAKVAPVEMSPTGQNP